MSIKQRPKWIADSDIWYLLDFLEKNLKDQYSFRNRTDLLQYVVLGLFRDLGYVEERLDDNDQLGLIMTQLGEHRLIIESIHRANEEEKK